MEELQKVIAQCAPYFRTWITVALDGHEIYLARPDGSLHLVEPVYCPAKSSLSRQIATYREIEEADYGHVQEALEIGLVIVETEDKGRGLIARWRNSLRVMEEHEKNSKDSNH